MINFIATILKFDRNGEKTGWTYIEISSGLAEKLNPGVKKSYRVKGKLDSFSFEKVAIVPIGEGAFILPLNIKTRTAIGKKRGDQVDVQLAVDNRAIKLSADLINCLREDHQAMDFFKTLAASHQRYFSKWIEDAKTQQTKTKRIVLSLTALAKKQSFSEMIRANKNN